VPTIEPIIPITPTPSTPFQPGFLKFPGTYRRNNNSFQSTTIWIVGAVILVAVIIVIILVVVCCCCGGKSNKSFEDVHHGEGFEKWRGGHIGGESKSQDELEGGRKRGFYGGGKGDQNMKNSESKSVHSDADNHSHPHFGEYSGL